MVSNPQSVFDEGFSAGVLHAIKPHINDPSHTIHPYDENSPEWKAWNAGFDIGMTDTNAQKIVLEGFNETD